MGILPSLLVIVTGGIPAWNCLSLAIGMALSVPL
jgi:hypothetical protein